MDDALNRDAQVTDIYVNHLYLSAYARSWADRIQQDVYRDPETDAEYLGGYAQAVRDIAEHLAQGVALPGGPVYRRVAQDSLLDPRAVLVS